MKAFYRHPSDLLVVVTDALCQSLIFRTYMCGDAFIDEHMSKGGNLESLAAHLETNPLEEEIPAQIDDEIEAARLQEEKGINNFDDDDDQSDNDYVVHQFRVMISLIGCAVVPPTCLLIRPSQPPWVGEVLSPDDDFLNKYFHVF